MRVGGRGEKSIRVGGERRGGRGSGMVEMWYQHEDLMQERQEALAKIQAEEEKTKSGERSKTRGMGEEVEGDAGGCWMLEGEE
eukprot:233005-Hanusia_phi.AAC.1